MNKDYISFQREVVTWIMNDIWIPEKQHIHVMWKLKNKWRTIILYNCEASVSCRWNIPCLKLFCVPKRYQIHLGNRSSKITHSKHFQFHRSRPLYGHSVCRTGTYGLGWRTVFNATVKLRSVGLGDGGSSKQVTWASLKCCPMLQKARTEQ